MPSEQIGHYEIEYEGVWLADVDGWGASLTVYGPSANPMHRHTVLPQQRVAVEQVFASQEEAAGAARQAALVMLEHAHG